MHDVIEFIKGFNIQTILSMAAIIWYFIHHYEKKMEKRLELQDERIFLLATGKTLQQAMLEAKKNKGE